MGQFAGASEQYGLPLSFIHPRDNDFAKAKFNPILLDPRLKLTKAQRRRMQQEIDELTQAMQHARTKVGN